MVGVVTMLCMSKSYFSPAGSKRGELWEEL